MAQRSPLWTDPETKDGRHEWLHVPNTPPAPKPPAPPEPPRRQRRAPLIAGAATLVVLLAGLTSFAVVKLTGDDAPEPGKAVAPLATSGGRPGQTRINEIYEKVSGSVVSIQVDEGSGAGASGTGFVIGADGTIATNDHVVENAQHVRVRFTDNGASIPARVIGADPSSDLAVIRVDTAQAPPLHPLTLADSSQVRVGDNAIAIGYPLGLDRTATAGIVSGLGREIKAPNGFTIDKVIQTDAPINPGNSGGPLIDERGRVIGINSQIATAGSQGNVGIGFAVPSNTIKDVVPQLERGQTIKRAYLGVSTSPSSGGKPGAAVADLTPGGPAERAGLRAGSGPFGEGGDVITSVDGKPIRSPDDLSSVVSSHKPGDRVSVQFLRNGQEREARIELGERPAQVP